MTATIGKAQKPQGNCQKCGKAINVGDPYRYFKVGFRSRVKNVRCMDRACSPRQSEMTASMMSGAFAAQEAADDALAQWQPEGWENAEEAYTDLVSILEECASGGRDVASEYENSIENAPMLEDQLRESIDALEQWADSLESNDLEEFAAEEAEDGDTQCEHCDGKGKCDVDSTDAEDNCVECGANSLENPDCGNCEGTGTEEGEAEDAEGNNADAFADWVEEQRGIAQDLIDGLEA